MNGRATPSRPAGLRLADWAVPAALAALVPALVMLVWHFNDHTLPTGDGANFFGGALDIYRTFAERGPLHGLWALYWDRTWRPIVFPDLLVPFLFVTGRDLGLSLALAETFLIAATAVYAFLLLRLTLDEVPALVGAALLGTAPVLHYQAVEFVSESAFAVLVLATLYHFWRSRWLAALGHSCAAVAFLALSVATRPAETILVLGLPLLWFGVEGWRRGRFPLRSLAAGVVVAAATLVVFVLCIYASAETSATMPRIAANGTAMLRRVALAAAFLLVAGEAAWLAILCAGRAFRTGDGAHRFLAAVLAASVLALAWWGPFARGLFEWVYQNTIGPLIHAAPSVAYGSAWGQWRAYFEQTGDIVVYGAAALAALGVVAWLSDSARRPFAWRLPALLFLTVPVIALTTLAGPQADPRRVAASIVAATLGLLAIGLADGRARGPRTAVALLLMLGQGGALAAASFDMWPHTPARRVLAGPMPVPYRAAEPNLGLIAFLNAHNAPGAGTWIEPVVFVDRANTFTLISLAPYFGNGYQVGLRTLLEFHGDADITWYRRKSGFSQVLLGIRDVPEGADLKTLIPRFIQRRDDNVNPYYKLDAHMALRYAQGRMPNLGLVPIARTRIDGNLFVLFRVERPGAAKSR